MTDRTVLVLALWLLSMLALIASIAKDMTP